MQMIDAVETSDTECLLPDSVPFVSVLMPIRNEGDFILRTLNAVLRQDYPSDRFEVIIADGMSTDNTRQVIESLRANHSDIRVIIVDNTRGIVATGINTALHQARGQIVVRVDGHTIIAADYIRRCVEALQRSGADNVGGRMDPVGQGLFGQAITLATTSRFGIGGGKFHYSEREAFVDTVYMGAWPRRVFEQVGLFDEEQVRNQDDEFNYRLRSKGGRILLCPQIQSRYFNRCTLRSLWRQYFQYGFWKVRVLQKHPRQMRPRQFAPFLLVITLSISLLAAPFFSIAAWILGASIGLYLIANVFASLAVAFRRPSWAVTLLPPVFAILHLAYGSGFLLGLWKFWNRWDTFWPKVRFKHEEEYKLGALGSMSSTSNLLETERERVLAEYRRRERELDLDTYAPWQPDQQLERNERKRLAASVLRSKHVFPTLGTQCLEIGYGTLGWLGELISWGIRETDLHGIEIDQSRARHAQELLPSADLRVGDAAELPWKENTFQLVIASTVFSSILDGRVRQMLADEIIRVLAPGGALLWYDFTVDNPRNPHVRSISREELRRLFPHLQCKIKSLTLAPPVARWIAPRSWVIATCASAIPLLRTHMLAVLTKP